jgi:cysteine dioxygenase
MQSLVRALSEEFAKPSASKAAITSLLGDYANSRADWKGYALTSPSCYTRNLVELNDQYELLVLCWDASQCSPIHNHEGQDCWMAVLDGPMEELHYEMPNGQSPLGCGPVRRFESGQVAYISDDIALHVVRAVEGTTAVSLHLYAKPFQQCNRYCPDTGMITRVSLSYHSVDKVLTGDSMCAE